MKELITGKLKEDFGAWYVEQQVKGINQDMNTPFIPINAFYQLPLSMQFGVIQDFAISKGKHIQIIPETPCHWLIDILVVDLMSPFYRGIETVFIDGDINEARIEAIKQFNYYYNKDEK